jgi:hypothetical protein
VEKRLKNTARIYSGRSESHTTTVAVMSNPKAENTYARGN